MHTYAERIGADAIRLERVLPGPIERVWSFLTESGQRARWLAAGEWDLRVGGKIELHFAHHELSGEATPARYLGMQMSFTGRVLRVEPPRLIEFTWLESHGATSEVTFELTPRGEQVALVITHRKITGREELLDVSGGWDVHAGILEDVLTGAAPRGFWSHHARMVEEYARRYGS
jgi:uncharacterized protein YndB with AHSA1/START domain